jgi:tape measure domain-containing protein
VATEEELVVHARLRDALSRPIAGVRREVERTTRSLRELSRAGVVAGGRRGLGSIDAATRGLGSRLRGAANEARGLGTALNQHVTRSARVAATAIGAITIAAGALGVNTAADFQMAEVSLRRLTGSAAEGKALFQFLTELDPMRPFDIGQLNQAAVTLASFGVKGQELQDTIAGLTNAVATNPAALDPAARAIGQMSQAGTIFAQDLNQLINAGIPGLNEAMEKAYGMTAAEVRRANERGASLASKPFLDALFAGAEGTGEEIATQTFRGLLSGVKSRAMLNLVDAFDPLLGVLQGQLPAMEAAFGSFVETIAPPLSDLLGTIVPLLGDFLRGSAPLLGAIFTGLGDLLAAAAPAFSLLDPVVDDLVLAIGELVTELVPVMPDLVHGFVLLVGLLPDFVRLLGMLVPLITPLVNIADALLSFGPTRWAVIGLLGAIMGFSALAGPTQALWGFVAALRGLSAAQAGAAAGGLAGGPGAAGGGLLGGLAKGAAGIGGAAGFYMSANDAAKNGVSVGNVLGGAASGAMLGATIGSIIPGAGTGAGALLGGAIGGGASLVTGLLGGRKASRPEHRLPAASLDNSLTMAPGAVVIDARGMSEAELARLIPRQIETYQRDRTERGVGASRGG